jgi:predicted nucleotidyltransferase
LDLRLRALLEPFLQEVRGAYKSSLTAVAVFGSLARGTAGPDSDVDLLIVAEDLPRGRLPRVQQFLPVEEALSARYPAFRTLQLSPIFKTPAEVELGSPLFWDMTEDAILLYDRNGFLQNHLEGVKRRLRELKARRVFKDNAWYWILKGDYKPGEVFEL